MGIKDGEISNENKERTGANVILVIKRQKTLLNCDLVFFGRSILEVTNLDI